MKRIFVAMSLYQEHVDWLTAKVAHVTDVSPDAINPGTPLADYGIDSVGFRRLSVDLNAEKKIEVKPTVLRVHASIGAIAAYLVGRGLPSSHG